MNEQMLTSKKDTMYLWYLLQSYCGELSNKLIFTIATPFCEAPYLVCMFCMIFCKNDDVYLKYLTSSMLVWLPTINASTHTIVFL